MVAAPTDVMQNRAVVARLLVIADDSAIASRLVAMLSARGFEVRVAGSVHDLDEALRWDPEIVVMENRHFVADPSSAASRVSDRGRLPIIVVGPNNSAEIVRVLEAGADEYICDLYRPHEVVARVRSVHRRYQSLSCASVRISRIEVGGIRLKADTGELEVHGSTQPQLSPEESRLLAELMRNAGRVVTREALASIVWRTPSARRGQELSDVVRQIRQRLVNGSGDLPLITTVRGKGYRFEHASSPS
jgi:two-component system phosphate regulon response regulator PhoB